MVSKAGTTSFDIETSVEESYYRLKYKCMLCTEQTDMMAQEWID